MLVQLNKAGVTPHDWLLIDNLLRRYTIRVQVKYKNGTRRYLPALKPSRGGMVQGLSSSSPLYTLLPRVLQDMVGQEILCAFLRIHPQLLEAYHMTKTGDATAMQDLDTDHIRMQGWKIEKLVVTAEEQDLGPQTIHKIREIMRECRNDAHRIHVVDWAAYAMGTKQGLQLTTNTGPSL